MCREKGKHRDKARSDLGSPLRVQGKDSARSVLADQSGITPACAGKRQLSHVQPHP